MSNESSNRYPQHLPHCHTAVISLSYFGEPETSSRDFILDILNEFSQSVPRFLNSLESAINTNDFATIKHLIHDMKATVFVLGFSEMIQSSMQFLEKGDLTSAATNHIRLAFQHIKNICLKALEEAQAIMRA